MKTPHIILIPIMAVISLFLISSFIVTAQKPGSCLKPQADGTSSCGKQSPDGCYCDTKQYNDYCSDIDSCNNIIQPTAAGSCQGKCGVYDAKASCQCDTSCEKQSPPDCCSDYQSVCQEQTSTNVVQSKEPLKMYVDVNYKGKEYFHPNYDKAINYLPVNDKIQDLGSISYFSSGSGYFNDKISSLELALGYVAIVYKNKDFSKVATSINGIIQNNAFKVFTESEPDLSKIKGPCDPPYTGGTGWSDCISSVKVCKKDDTNCIQQATQGGSVSEPVSKFTCTNCEFQASSGKWLCNSCNA